MFAIFSSLLEGLSPHLEHYLIDVAPAPILSRLEGLNNGMVGRVEMFCGMFVLRGIAAANMPAFQANAQVNPAITGLQTILTSLCAGRDIMNMVKVRTLLCHRISPFA